MKKIRIGIICPSEIAIRRFMPALEKIEEIEYVGVAYPSLVDWNNASEENIDLEYKKAIEFKNKYGGKIFNGYRNLVESNEIDAVYIPLPPALHYKWAKLALENNKHVFLEKPSTTSYNDTSDLIKLAKYKNLALHENYMFQYHNQIRTIKEIIDSNIIGEIRLIRTNFGFPKRDENDFRYNKNLGGGALLDCGGYPIRLISNLLGENLNVDAAKLFYNENGVDLYGSVQLSTKDRVAQISFGMDNSYKCDIEIWGSLGTIFTDRIFTAPNNLDINIKVQNNKEEKNIHVDSDDSFYKSIKIFLNCINDKNVRNKEYDQLLNQSYIIEQIRKESK